MKTVVLGCGAALAVVLAASSTQAQVRQAAEDREPQVHRLEIYNGPLRTIHYISRNTSSGDQATLADLERAENQASVGDLLAGLHRQYLVNESEMEHRRHQVQMLLYGYASETGNGGLTGSAPFAGYPYAARFGYANYYAGSPYLGVAGYGASATNSLANGIGDEGALKTDLARTWSAQATPERIAELRRDRDAAVARVSESGGLRNALRGTGVIVPAAAPPSPPSHVVVTMKKGAEKIEGTLVNQDKDWMTIEKGKERVSIRKSDVERFVETEAKPTVKPANIP